MAQTKRKLSSVGAKERAALDYVHNADDAFLECRIKHDFPPIKFKNGHFTAKVDVYPNEEFGGLFIRQWCKRSCGCYRFITTRPDNTWDFGQNWQYRYTNSRYLAEARGVSPRMCTAEQWRRALEDRAVFLRDKDTAPEVRFSNRE